MNRQGKVLDASMLKVIAVVSMIVDHTASILLWDTYITVFHIGTYMVDLYNIMRIFGRISFPIFAFLLTEGFLHTGNVKRYARNLLLFALISEIPWNLAHTGHLFWKSQNVMFTLLFGLLGLWLIRDFAGEGKKKGLLLTALLVVAILFHADYAARGFGFILMLYLLREQKLYRAIVGCCFLSDGWLAGLAFIPISLYNGRRGFIKSPALKYAFYLIYPFHLLVLYGIRRMTIGY